MRPNDDRAVRIVVGALLCSDLSSRELHAFAAALEGDPLCAQRLGTMLNLVADMVGESEARRPKASQQAKTPEAELSERLCAMLQTRGITTSQFLAMVHEVAPSMNWAPGPRWSKKRIAESFVTAAHPSVVGEVIQRIIGGDPVSDPYLIGLLRRGGI